MFRRLWMRHKLKIKVIIVFIFFVYLFICMDIGALHKLSRSLEAGNDVYPVEIGPISKKGNGTKLSVKSVKTLQPVRDDNGIKENQNPNVNHLPVVIQDVNDEEVDRNNEVAEQPANVNQPPPQDDNGERENKFHNENDLLAYRQKRYLEYQARGPRSGPGENGVPVILTGEEEKEAVLKMKKASINVVASEKISMGRSLPDFRINE